MKSIYIIGERNSTRLKIGISANPARRLKNIMTDNPYDVEVLWDRIVHRARRVEMNAHLVLADVRIRGEWFNVTLADAIAVIEKIIALQEEVRKPPEGFGATAEHLPNVSRLRFPRV